ncbi:MAG: ATP-binding cassette domain-containing protein [Anaerovoracaceae bacterium]|nr:ATP-binding cassette domain-containing protein [Anaerovoracaceae bacterium]
MKLKAERIDFTYPKEDKAVLTDFSAEFSSEHITALVGPSGCGKTTLTKILMGLLKPCSGRVMLDGEDLSQLSLAQIGRRMGYVMQNPAHCPQPLCLRKIYGDKRRFYF